MPLVHLRQLRSVCVQYEHKRERRQSLLTGSEIKMTRKLGCRPAETRAGQPHLSVMRGFCARKAPPHLIRDHIDPAPLMLGNDVLGDCTSAGLGNHARATAALGGFQVDVTTAQGEAFYSLSTGYVLGDAINVNGGYAMVTHNRVSNAGDGCIAFNNGARGTISDNVLTKCNLVIGAGPEGETTDTDIAQNISITANTFDTCQYGVNMGDYGYAGRSGPVNWQITGNTFRDTENVGIEYDINPAAPINGTITGNTFYGTGSTNYDGTAYANAHDIRINGGSNINIVGNSFMSPKATANTQTAVKVYNSTSYNISNNTVYDPAGGHYIYTLYSSYSTNGTINGNTITNAGTGILFDGTQGMYYSTASNNIMIGMATNGVEVVTEAYFSVMMGNVMSVNSAGTGILLPSKGLMFSVVGNVITMGSGTAITPAPSSGWTDVTIYANTPGGSTVPAAIINGVTQ
ncbi:right-handed parallel beta-helix repeat-containing protein [Gluconacetobacter entanii]|nr:right-handed parallel beta-helix repeat-containing protein [Gluconacetobacter entanii]